MIQSLILAAALLQPIATLPIRFLPTDQANVVRILAANRCAIEDGYPQDFVVRQAVEVAAKNQIPLEIINTMESKVLALYYKAVTGCENVYRNYNQLK